ncbi:unnamed protein product [Diplocarpon coronariae]
MEKLCKTAKAQNLTEDHGALMPTTFAEGLTYREFQRKMNLVLPKPKIKRFVVRKARNAKGTIQPSRRTSRIHIYGTEETKSRLGASQEIAYNNLYKNVVKAETMRRKSRKIARFKKKPEGRVFTLFPKLPLELRMMVLETAVSELAPRIVSVFDPTPKKVAFTTSSPCKPVASYAIPALLHTYSESRRIAKKTYDAVFSTNLRGAPVYFNFSQDILLFDDYQAMMWFFSFIDEVGATTKRILSGTVVEKKIPVIGILNAKWEHLVISNNLAENMFRISKEIILLRQDRVRNSFELFYRDWCVRFQLAIMPIDLKPESKMPIIGHSTVNQMRAKFGRSQELPGENSESGERKETENRLLQKGHIV